MDRGSWSRNRSSTCILYTMPTSSIFRYSTLLVLAYFLFSGCASEAPNSDDAIDLNLRIASFNIRYHNPNDGVHAWPNRVDRVASTILFNQVDIVGVQEALKDQIVDLENKLPGYNWVGVGRDDGKEAGEFAPIFYKEDRFEVLESGTFWLSKTPDVPGSKDWDAAITRIATWVHFQDNHTNVDFFHFNTHFDHRGAVAREKSAELIANRLRRTVGTSPGLVTGDFNFVETTTGYSVLTQSLRDAMYHSIDPHHGPTGTFSGFEVGSDLENRIDYIFVTENVEVLQHAILSDNWNGAYASDHLPVIATVRF